MNQCAICLYFNRKGLSAQEIHNELVKVLGFDAIASSTVTSYLHASHWTAQKEEQHSARPPDVVDNAILQALNQTSFASVRKLAKSTYISCATVWRRLTGSL
jgi:hypothetical protein